jgi:hypothetical protein
MPRRKSSRETVTVAARCFGVSIAVRCRPIDVSAVSAHLPIDYTPDDTGRLENRFNFDFQAEENDLFSVKRGLSVKAVPGPLPSALRSLQKEIHLCVAEHATERVFIHAGVVAWENRAIILPGSSRAGKSTLVWSLVQAGAVYYSDEYAVFDENGSVYPFPLPISLRLQDGQRRMIMPDRVGTAPLAPDLIAFARYRPGAIWLPHALKPAQTVLQLLRHSIAIRRNPSFVFPVLTKISLRARSFAGMRSNTAKTVEWLSARMTKVLLSTDATGDTL